MRFSHELIRSVYLTPIPSIITDAKARDNPIIAANGHFEELSGYAESELLGRNCRILAGPGTAPEHSAALARAVETALPTVVRLLNYRKDGSKFINAVMVAPVFDDEGRPAYFIGSQMAVDEELPGRTRAGAAERVGCLTRKQRAVLELVARGMRSRQIARELGLAEKTVKMHRSALVRRLGLGSTTEAIRLAIEAGL